MTPSDLQSAPVGLDSTPRSPETAGTVRNWAAENGRPVEVDPEPAAIIDGIRAHDPDKADRLRDAIDRFPAVGTRFAGFQLVSILGRGAFGRVYLAQQADLAERYVVLKISTDLTGESRALAQLQHTNIVPLYSVHRTHLLQAVCMPFFGSATVAGLLQKYRKQNSLPTTGRELVDTLNVLGDQTDAPAVGPASTKVPVGGRFVSRPAPADAPGDAPQARRENSSTGILTLLRGLSYVDAVCWIGARLADALAHAHDRGIVHNDLKPANILLTDEGQPMLLDFGVSEDLKLRSAAGDVPVGGTLPYMSPEQLDSVRDPAARTDGRSDVYSLGIILFELLTGRYPFRLPSGGLEEEQPRMAAERRAGPPWLRQLNPAVSPGLEAVVRRCLHPDPARRYQSAADLRDDLERHRANLPLVHAAEPIPERVKKWARRHPRMSSNATIATLAAALVALLATGIDRRNQRVAQLEAEAAYQKVRQEAEVKLRQVQPDLAEARYRLSTRAPDADMLSAGVVRCRAALDRYGLLDDPRWEERSGYAMLTPGEQRQLRRQLSDICLLFARGRLLQGKAVDDDRLKEAARLNELAEQLADGEVPQAVWAQRAELAERRGERAEAELLAARTKEAPLSGTRDYYLAGTDKLIRGEYREALKLLRTVTDLDPAFSWAYMAQGLCHEGFGQLAEARSCYATAVALRPDFHWAYFNRGLVSLRLRDFKAAKADLDKVAELKPEFADSYVNRSLAHQGLKDYPAAIADLDKAQELGSGLTRIYFMRSRVRDLAGDKTGAKKDFDEGLRHEPGDHTSLVARGVARLETDLPGALADFEAALGLNPRSQTALQNKSHALSKLGRNDEAVRALDRMLEVYPDFVPARVGRGVMHGRLGNVAAALADAEGAMARDPGPATLYQAAGIYALLSKHDPRYRTEAFRLLAAGLRGGFGFEHIETDKDLDPIRDTEEFKRIVDGARSLRADRNG
jgi:serine/threonine protein kinase/lipoprotein NlpI